VGRPPTGIDLKSCRIDRDYRAEREMAEIEAKLEKLGLKLPEPLKAPPGLVLPFKQVLIRGNHGYIAGHAPQHPDGSIAGPLGKVGKELTVEQGYQAARLVALSMLGDLKRAIGDLDRVVAWLKVLGMVNVAPGFNQTPQVINGFSELIIELYGPERGGHTRSAVGLAELPLNIPVEIEAEVEIAG
jgi:enamine deaminase RidA (YjgF/YER057c/UK114 family)